MDVRAVGYVVVNAMLSSLTTANQFDEWAERVIRDLTLSAQITARTLRARGAPQQSIAVKRTGPTPGRRSRRSVARSGLGAPKQLPDPGVRPGSAERRLRQDH